MTLDAGAPCRVRVVEGVPDVAEMLTELVKTHGHHVECVTDPREAVKVATKFQPRIVLLDIGMPHINGYQLAPLLRTALSPTRVAIIAVTAWGSVQDQAHSKAAGFDAHLVKPAGDKMIADVLKKYG